MKPFRSICTSPINPISIIKHIEFPVCKDCIHFIKYNVTEFDYHPIDREMKMSKCNKFGMKDLISGKIDYDSTSSCRFDKDKCSISGKYFYPISKINKIEL
jgi:hypothetical protein